MSRRLRMLDLFAGLGGASAVMRERGWFVVTVELERSLRPDVVADVRRSPVRGEWDLIWASPPCTEFSRSFLPWMRGKYPPPDLSLVEAENVKGAQSWLGPARWVSPRSDRETEAAVVGDRRNPVYLWGQFPPFDCRD